MRKHIPRGWQSILWSVKISQLNVKENQNYIIHQILNFGTPQQIRELFGLYGSNIIKQVFLKKPQKIYNVSRLSFIKNIILDLKNVPIKKKQYIQTLF